MSQKLEQGEISCELRQFQEYCSDPNLGSVARIIEVVECVSTGEYVGDEEGHATAMSAHSSDVGTKQH